LLVAAAQQPTASASASAFAPAPTPSVRADDPESTLYASVRRRRSRKLSASRSARAARRHEV